MPPFIVPLYTLETPGLVCAQSTHKDRNPRTKPRRAAIPLAVDGLEPVRLFSVYTHRRRVFLGDADKLPSGNSQHGNRVCSLSAHERSEVSC
jgi:hypothetical protein